MIKATELRIGNWVHTQHRKMVKGLHEPIQLKVVTPQEEHKWEPIPLSAEWLERMGFKWHEEGKVYSIQVGNALYIDLDMDFDCSITPETWRGSPVTVWADIKYVHQLQNLFHSLTGKELEIKL